MKVSKLFGILAAVAVAVFLGTAAAKAANFSVLVEPVEVFNSAEAKELGPGIRSMVASRIAGQGYSVSTDMAQKGIALFSLRTTLTRLGGMYSIDAELTSTAAGIDGARAYETVPDIDSLMKGMDKVAERVRYRLWQVAASRGDASAEKNDAPPLDRHPPPAYQPLPPFNAAPAAPLTASAPAGRSPTEALSTYKEEAKINGEVMSLASADLDGDGSVELIVLHEKEATIFRETAKGLERLWNEKLDLGFKPLWVSVGDVDRDRAVEIFVGGASGADAYTQVFTWRNNALTKKGPRVYAFIRVYSNPESGVQALGLKSSGGVDVFRPGLRVFTWTGTEWEDGAKFALPDYTGTMNIQWLKFGQASPALFVLDREKKIRIYGQNNEKLYVTEKNFQGTRARIEGEPRDTRNLEPGDIWEMNPTPIMWDAPDGFSYAVLHANIEPSIVSNRWGFYDNGSLVALRWDGMALHTGGESPKFQGFFSATARGATTGNGRGKIYAALVRTEGSIFKSYKTTILSFDL